MKTYEFGFIGCGNMGSALAQAVSHTSDSVACCDVSEEKATALACQCGIAVLPGAAEIAETCRGIFLAVKPQGLEALAAEIKPVLAGRSEPFFLITMAAGIEIGTIQRLFGNGTTPIIRITPNTPVAVGEGMILYTANESVTAGMLQQFLSAMKAAGKSDPIAEDRMDAASALSGCAPAFVCLFAEALADGAVACGLSRDKANFYAAQTLLGSAKLLLESGKHPAQLKDAVCSPGGTTIEGVRILEGSAFRAAAMNAVTVAYEKTLSLKKGNEKKTDGKGA